MENMGIKIEIPAPVLKAIEALNSAGREAYIVGGAVRDAVMGFEPHDYDIATPALPEETEKIFSSYRVIETGMKHGTVTVLIDGMPLEITTYRIDGEYTDRRRPDEVKFTSELKADLSRRDFTCNALAYHPVKGFADYFGGIDDIGKGIIRCVGDPEKRFGEDALRILRALRFSSVLGFEIDEATSGSIHSMKNLLEYVSEERIFVELMKLLAGKDAGRILREYEDVIFFIMPALEAMKGCPQNHPRHVCDVWEHTVRSVENIRGDSELRLAMLLHDSGKPSVRVTDGEGVDHFYSHAEKSAEIARDILNKFKTSNKIRHHVCTLVERHGFTPHTLGKKTYKRYIGAYGIDVVRELFEVREADVRAQNPDYLEESLAENRAGLEVLDEILNNEACFSLKDLAVDGRDLIDAGFDTSEYLGKVLSALLSEVMDNSLENEKEALIKRAKEFLNEN